MRGPDASSGEMPGFPFPGRPGRDHDEPVLDTILDGKSPPPDSPQEMHALAEVLASLAGPAEPGDLAGEAAALTAFTRSVSPARISAAARRPARRRSPWSQRPRRPRLAVGLAVLATLLGGTAAAYADVLPAPVQEIAHETFGAPAPQDHGQPVRRRDHGQRGRHGHPAPRGQAERTRPGPKDPNGPRATPSGRARGYGRTRPGKPASNPNPADRDHPRPHRGT